MNRYVKRGWRPFAGALTIGLMAFGLSLQGAPASEGDDIELSSARGIVSTNVTTAISSGEAALEAGQSLGRDRSLGTTSQATQSAAGTGEEAGAVEDEVRHRGRVIGSAAVATKSGSASARVVGTLQLGEACSCDEDCDGALGDQCNTLQCVVRSTCSDTGLPCSVLADCPTGTCTTNPANCETDPLVDCAFVQRCDTRQLVDFACDLDGLFCTADRCEDDGTGEEHSICVAQDDGSGAAALSTCAKQCVAGPAGGLRCDRSSQCPQSACAIKPQGLCDEDNDICVVQSLTAPIGRCCTAGTCTESDETTCTGGGGSWVIYNDPEERDGNQTPDPQGGPDSGCICPKYGSGVAPNGVDSGPVGLVRPSHLVCEGSLDPDNALIPVLCETPGLDLKFCAKRCVGGDNAGGICQDDTNCALEFKCTFGQCTDRGLCSTAGTVCDPNLDECPPGETCDFVTCDATIELNNPTCDAIAPFLSCAAAPCDQAIGDADCTLGAPGTDFCTALSQGLCQEDVCGLNTVEGGCVPDFLSIGDDYSIANGSFLRLTQFRFRGGVSILDEDIIFEIWARDAHSGRCSIANTVCDPSNNQCPGVETCDGDLRLVDNFFVEMGILGVNNATGNLPITGPRDWTIELDCWPNCNLAQLEIAQSSPIIIPPNGWVVMRSPRIIGTFDAAAASWNQTDAADVGANDPTTSWVNGDPNGSQGTNVYIFELVGVKIPPPLGARCLDAISCVDTVRWEGGICTDTDPPVICASTLHDCPRGGLNNQVCRDNRWFGPQTHQALTFGDPDVKICGGTSGISPCDQGACCQGGVGGICTVETPDDCTTLGGVSLGVATNCDPDCCPQLPTGSDCICPTSVCEEADGTNVGIICTTSADCDPGQTCELQCVPNTTTLLNLPFECFDAVFGQPLAPPVLCDPALNDADCNAVQAGALCKQSFNQSVTVSVNGTIPENGKCTGDGTTNCTTNADCAGVGGVCGLSTAEEGELCSLNTAADRVGWFEKVLLDDLTSGDGADDCFILTVSLCCTDPFLTPIWPFLSQFRNCPCIETADVIGIAPDIDASGDQKDGREASKANFPCFDGNYSATFTVPPGEYAYQVNADTVCVGTTITCDTSDDCIGSACVVPNPDYQVNWTVESCQVAACCVGETCVVTNELDCAAQQGSFLGGGDQPIVSCAFGICDIGSCCLNGQCDDVAPNNTKAGCEGQGGVYLGGVDCVTGPCPACPFQNPANCQIMQTIFGAVPMIDRNPANGPNGDDARVLADDVKFGSSPVDNLCWNTGFFNTPCCQTACVQNVDDTWEVKIYEAQRGQCVLNGRACDPALGAAACPSDTCDLVELECVVTGDTCASDTDCAGVDTCDAALACDGVPGLEIGFSAITVLNKVEGTGQGTGTWLYSGTLSAPIGLPAGGLAGDTYWMEISAFGEEGCETRATWSRDDGNEHSVFSTTLGGGLAAGLGVYFAEDTMFVDVGLCEDSGIGNPGDIVGNCCSCPAVCTSGVTQRECNLQRGVWTVCETCPMCDDGTTPCTTNADCVGISPLETCVGENPCPGVPVNDDCGSALPIVGVPTDGTALIITGDNICATTDGPDLDTGSAECGGSSTDFNFGVWYTYTSNFCGELTISGCDDSDYDQMIAVYDTAACPVATGNELACSDDECGSVGGASKLTLTVTPNQEILIRIGGWNNAPNTNAGAGRGNYGVSLSFGNPCAPVEAPTLAGPPHDILKNRYISIDPRGALGLNSGDLDIKVTLTSTLVNGVTAIGSEWWANAPDADCISILGPTQPAVQPNFDLCPTLHLGGCPIMPTSDYDIVVIDPNGAVSDPPLSAQTQAKPSPKWFGDIVGPFDGTNWEAPNGVVSIDDALAAIKTFQDLQAINATHLTVSDIQPNRPDLPAPGNQINKVVNIADVLSIIIGFQGNEYPGPQIELCLCEAPTCP